MCKSFTRYMALALAFVFVFSVGGVLATWQYATELPEDEQINLPLGINPFYYKVELPEEEETLLERMYDILNNSFSCDAISEGESLQYLLSTLDKDWEQGVAPGLGTFVGSMDKSPETQARIQAMFGDVIDLDKVSFILKSEDLVGSVDNEIALYSTLDPLGWNESYWTPMVVGVYLSVFVPVLDEAGKVIGYEQLCDSIHGYCTEVAYTAEDKTPSFSTTHWRDELFYWSEFYPDLQPIVGEDRYKYECYHTANGTYPYEGRTESWLGWIEVCSNQWASGPYTGKKASEKLEEILAMQNK